MTVDYLAAVVFPSKIGNSSSFSRVFSTSVSQPLEYE
jgi:hypothetical protein